uniref:Protein kinase domain-containing protein n=1 Tax=Parastrongyloides trichosuri TaxID=131310 RepID=A0A0N4ZP17_PARTI
MTTTALNICDNKGAVLSPNSNIHLENGNLEEYEKLEGTTVDNWHVHEIIGKGAFGCVYRCTTKTTSGEIHEAAIKCEKRQHETNSSFLKIECTILLKLAKNGDMGNFTVLYSTGEKPSYDYMIMTLLGPNLFDICSVLPGEKMEMGTWVRVMYQALSAIQSLHEIRYIHLDIKPANFALGHKNDPIRSQVIHLLDFGLARKYGSRTNPKIPNYIAPKQGVEYVGTVTHCSPYAHLRVELSRRDDMWGWLFMAMDLYNELPWRSLQDDVEIENLKKTATYELYCEYLPKRLHPVIYHIMKLGTYDYPDYELCFTQLLFIMKDKNIKVSDPYQWDNLPNETKEALRLKINTGKTHFVNNEMKKKLEFLCNEDKKEEPSKELSLTKKILKEKYEKIITKTPEADQTQKSDSIKEVKDKKVIHKVEKLKKKKIINEELKEMNVSLERKIPTREYSLGFPKKKGIYKKEKSPDENKNETSAFKQVDEHKKTPINVSIERALTPRQNIVRMPTKGVKTQSSDNSSQQRYTSTYKRVKRRRHKKKAPAVNVDPHTIIKVQKRFKDNMLLKSSDKVKAKDVVERRILKEKNSINVIKKMNDDYKAFITQRTQHTE